MQEEEPEKSLSLTRNIMNCFDNLCALHEFLVKNQQRFNLGLTSLAWTSQTSLGLHSEPLADETEHLMLKLKFLPYKVKYLN